MGFRRSPDRIAAARDWSTFIGHNAAIIAAAGIPAIITGRIADWDDFLIYGFLAVDPGGFNIDRLTAQQYASLLELVGNYFAAGYEFYTPLAMRFEDQATLRARFDRAGS